MIEQAIIFCLASCSWICILRDMIRVRSSWHFPEYWGYCGSTESLFLPLGDCSTIAFCIRSSLSSQDMFHVPGKDILFDS
ncbi:hypothetical protein SERLADRAFT_379550 [Serpula lacrymans var. lacrymans S7.9]|uniref:Uncharacterized protein n=1 Tax=Serpula lacrymans var. lacrymans (strain S7.9) TaxID=578457 RepID=F8NHE5_SERL9|nr:uncharacterized protein SERLADRAFT_379550 [Serpula lacrymans var. lacrymans S7.9]EGO29948.1 hypothetical protein SERLADRAFT_379550 [Serpula lacrymans var. lacrymans S7.9]